MSQSVCRMFRRTLSVLMPLALLLTAVPSAVQAQSRTVANMTTKTGTLVEVTKKGRIQILKYTDDAGEEQQVVLNAKIKAEVEADGDGGFLQPGLFFVTLATMTNDQLFAGDVTIYLFGSGRPPAGKVVKAPAQTGQSENAYRVTGVIAAIGPDPDYPDYQRVALKVAGRIPPIMLKKDITVTVKSTDMSLASKGATLEMEGIALKNGSFKPAKITAKLDEPLKSTDVLGPTTKSAEGKGKSKPVEKPGPKKSAE